MVTEDGSSTSEDNILPDERSVIIDRLDELENRNSHLSVEDVANDLGINIEEL